MKRIIYTMTLFIFSIIVSGCRKEAINTGFSITGIRELREAQTGMTPAMKYAAGNDNIVLFSATTYQYYSNRQLVKTGTYTVTKNTQVMPGVCIELPQGQYLSAIIFDNDINHSKRFELTGNLLNFLSGGFCA